MSCMPLSDVAASGEAKRIKIYMNLYTQLQKCHDMRVSVAVNRCEWHDWLAVVFVNFFPSSIQLSTFKEFGKQKTNFENVLT